MFNLETTTYIHVFDKTGHHRRLFIPAFPEGFTHYRNALKYIDDMKYAGTPLPEGASPVDEYDEPERIPVCSSSPEDQVSESSLMTVS